MRIQFHLTVIMLATCHALKLALFTFILRIFCDFTELFVHLPVFFNVWRDFDTFPIIFNPFLNFWEVNELRWIAFTVGRVIVRMDVIKSSRKLDFNFTFFLDSIFRMWSERRTGCWNARFLDVCWERRQAFLENLLAFFLIIPIAGLARRNLNKDLSRFLHVQRSRILWHIQESLFIFSPWSFRFHSIACYCFFVVINWWIFINSFGAWLLDEWGSLFVYWDDWGDWNDWFQCYELYLFYHFLLMWLFCD